MMQGFDQPDPQRADHLLLCCTSQEGGQNNGQNQFVMRQVLSFVWGSKLSRGETRSAKLCLPCCKVSIVFLLRDGCFMLNYLLHRVKYTLLSNILSFGC